MLILALRFVRMHSSTNAKRVTCTLVYIWRRKGTQKNLFSKNIVQIFWVF